MTKTRYYVFVMGDESPSNGIDLSPNSVLRVYEIKEYFRKYS